MNINIVDKNKTNCKTNHPICSNSQEKERLSKLFEIFIEIDKNLKNKSYENNK